MELTEGYINAGLTIELPDGTLVKAINCGDSGVGWISWEPFAQYHHFSEWYTKGSKVISRGYGPLIPIPVSLPAEMK